MPDNMKRFRTVDRQTGEATRYIEMDPTTFRGTVYYVDHDQDGTANRSPDHPLSLCGWLDYRNRIEQWAGQDGQRIVSGWGE